jgi:hypothetical protein
MRSFLLVHSAPALAGLPPPPAWPVSLSAAVPPVPPPGQPSPWVPAARLAKAGVRTVSAPSAPPCQGRLLTRFHRSPPDPLCQRAKLCPTTPAFASQASSI